MMEVVVEESTDERSKLPNSIEQASVKKSLIKKLGIQNGQQIFVYNPESRLSAAFTVFYSHQNREADVLLSENGLEPLAEKNSFTGKLSTTVPRPSLTYQEAWKTNQAVETTWHKEGQDFLAAIAPHGGDMEACTDQIAVELYKNMSPKTASVWTVHSFGDDVFDLFHIKSNRLHPDSYPGLRQLTGIGFEHAISFHVKKDAEKIEVGGLAGDSFREQVASVVRDAVKQSWDTVTDYEDGEYMAESEDNVVNRLTVDSRSGVQIELPVYAARNYRKRIARHLAEFYYRIR